MKRVITLAIVLIMVLGSFGAFGTIIKNNEEQNEPDIYEDDCGCETYVTTNKIINSDSKSKCVINIDAVYSGY